MFAILLAIITAFVITYFAIPSIIEIARTKKIYDLPNERSSHEDIVPRLGGIGIFAGTLFAIILWVPFWAFGELQYILCSFILIFLSGAKDDIVSISPTKKFLAQGIAAFILVFRSGVRLDHFYGFLGIGVLPEMASFFLSIFAIVGIINAFNLIDGVNGLAGGIGLFVSVVFGNWFFAVGQTQMALVAAGLSGALIAFLRFNLMKKAQIFMGDTGSMLLGLISAILALKFLELNRIVPTGSFFHFPAAPAVALAALVLPLFDTVQVFSRRILSGKSPFYPDKTHIHHMMLDCGLAHLQTTASLIAFNFALVALAVGLQKLGVQKLILLEVAIVGTVYWILMKKSAACRAAKAAEK